MIKNKDKVLVLMYNPLELFPPTLNALELLSKQFKQVHTLSSYPNYNSSWLFAQNIVNYYCFKNKPQKSLKAGYFKFMHSLNRLFKNQTYDLVLIYDGIALALCYPLKNKLFRNNIIWYHSHDVFDLKFIRKFSLTRLFSYLEKVMIKRVNLISVPDFDRLSYFGNNNTPKFLLPNYPLLSKLSIPYREIDNDSILKIIYQGRISEGHGFRELLAYMKADTHVFLTIIGFISNNYRKELNSVIAQHELSDRVVLLDAVPYEKLVSYTLNSHVGWAINKPENVMYATGGSASNKIYEYIKCGLPIIYFDSQTYKKKLSDYSFAFASDLSYESLSDAFKKLRHNYSSLSKEAVSSHLYQFNFNFYFSKILSNIYETQKKNP